MSVKISELDDGMIIAEVTVAVASPALVDEDILAGPCKVHSMQGESKANAYFVKMFNDASPTLGTDKVDEQEEIPTAGLDFDYGNEPLEFEEGLSITCTDAGTDAGVNLTNNAAVVNLVLSRGV